MKVFMVAETPEDASRLMAVQLAPRGLGREGILMQEIDTTEPAAYVLCDGDC